MLKWLLMSLALTGCAEYQQDLYATKQSPHTSRTAFIEYSAPLVKVERPADVKKRYGTTAEIKIDTSKSFFFEDSLLRTGIFLSHTQVNFTVFNKSDHTMKLLWDDAVFIEPDNSTTRIMHEGIKFTDKNNSMPASIIPRRGKIEDLATPTNRVSWREGYGSVSGEWQEDGIFKWEQHFQNDSTAIPTKEIAQFYESAQKNIGAKVGLLLPFEIEGVKNEYTFWFQVQKVELDTSSAATTSVY